MNSKEPLAPCRILGYTLTMKNNESPAADKDNTGIRCTCCGDYLDNEDAHLLGMSEDEGGTEGYSACCNDTVEYDR